MNDFYNSVLNVLKQDDRFFSENGELLRNAVYEAAMKMDSHLIKILYADEITRAKFFTDIDGIAVFDKVGFGWVINNRDFLPDSYTRYKNRIGLINSNDYLISSTNDISLAFPYKDCILEFDSTKESIERKEIFFNETLAVDEVDCLLYPKVFSNVKLYDSQGEHQITTFDKGDNLIIKGNNLLALYTLLPNYNGRIKCMYWDILYNTDNDKVPYNDSFKHSSWLVMMKNRLEVAYKLLSNDGLIFIQCDDKEMAYLKVLCDEIFNRNNGYINTITVKTKIAGVSGSTEGKSLIDATEFILVYAKNKQAISLKPTTSGTPLLDVLNDYKETGKSWKYTSVLIDKGTKELLFEDIEKGYKYYGYKDTKSVSVSQYSKMQSISEDDVYLKHYDKIFRTTNAQSSVRGTVEEKTGHLSYDFVGLEYTPIKGKNAGKQIEILYKGASRAMVTFLSEMIINDNGTPLYKDRVSTIWTDIDYNNLKKEGGVELPFGKKPEKLVSRIIDLCVDDGDIILDAYLGTGTTAAIAHKRNIQYIGIEQLDSHIELSKKRLLNVIAGDSTGVSREFEWTGGGSFVYCELSKLNQKYVDEIENADNDEKLISILEQIIKTGFISYKVNPADIDANADDFESLSLDDKKRLLMELIDKNQLYVNYCDIDDTFEISAEDKAFTKSFYEEV